MHVSSENIVLSGAGLSALFIAKFVKTHFPEKTVTIVDASSEVGGQFGSIDFGPHGLVDHGMHVYYDCCVPEVDQLIQSALPDSEWNIYHDNEKDVAGIFFNGKLQTHSPYPDLRALPADKLARYAGDLLQSCANPSIDEPQNSYDFLLGQFGKSLADEIFVPILEKLHLRHPRELHLLASRLTAINRVNLFDFDFVAELSAVEKLRDRIAFPDQMALPRVRVNNQRALYPAKFGFSHATRALQHELIKMGVKFHLKSRVNRLGIAGDRVSHIHLTDGDQNDHSIECDQLYWAAGLTSLAKFLGVSLQGFMPEKRPPTYFVYFKFGRKPMMDGLYYFYCFDRSFRSFRVTNYSGYCPQAANEGFPICVEFWSRESDSLSDADILSLARRELESFGVVARDWTASFSAVYKGNAIPIPSLSNMHSLDRVRDEINQKNLLNLTSVGLLSESHVFFISEVLRDAYDKVRRNFNLN